MRSHHIYKPQIILSLLFGLLLFLVPTFASANAAMDFIHNSLWTLVNNLFGLFLAFGGLFLNAGINDFVIGFGDRFSASGVGAVVNSLWVNVRDLFNLTFIFGLVFIGFKMILNSDDSNTRRWLVSLIMAALLVNFSLFITKFVVDVTNILASEIALGGLDPDGDGVVEVTDSFMDMLGVTTIWGGGSGGSKLVSKIPENTHNAFGYIFGSAIIFMVAGFVFAAGGIMLIIRYVALVLYMIFSPLMFIGWVFPQLQSITRKYWQGFLGRAFFAPVYILLVYFSLKIFEGLKSTSASGDFQKILASDGSQVTDGFTPTLVAFAIACILLISSLTIASKMGADGAGAAVRMGNGLQKKVRRETGRFATRNTAGYGARAVNRVSEGATRRYNRLSNTRTGRNIKRAAAVGSLGILSDKNVRSGLAAGTKVSVGGSETAQQVRDSKRINQRAINQEMNEHQREENVTQYLAAATAAGAAGDTEGRRNAVSAIGNEVRDMSPEELNRLDRDTLFSPEVAQHLTEGHMKGVRDSGEHSNDDIDELRGARDDGMFAEPISALETTAETAEQVNTALEQLGRTIRGLSNDRLEGLDINRLSDPRLAMHLNQNQLDHLRDSGRVTSQQMTGIQDAREHGLRSITTGSYEGRLINQGVPALAADNFNQEVVQRQRELLMQQSTQKAGQLPVEVFTDPNMAAHLTPQALEERMRNGISQPDLSTIKQNIESHIGALPNNDPATARLRQGWQKWTDRSVYGGQLDLQLEAQPQIIV